MRTRGLACCVVVAVIPTGCGGSTSGAASLLPCSAGEQRIVSYDLPGPGQPTPEEAVLLVDGSSGLSLEVRTDGEQTTVLGRDDGVVIRVYEVTEKEDGWWPDGYRECLN